MASSLTNSLFAVGEFSVKSLLAHHFSSAKKVYVTSKQEAKKYQDYHLPVTIDPHYIAHLVKKGDIYAIAEFTPYLMRLTKGVHLLIHDLNDAGEIGTIIRTALCFDIKNIALINSSVNLFSRQLIRASAGAFFMANIVIYPNKASYLKAYPNSEIIEFKNKNAPLSLEVGAKLYERYAASMW